MKNKIDFIEVEYIGSGTFKGGEDCNNLIYDENEGFKHNDFIVIRKEDFQKLTKCGCKCKK